MSGVRRRGERLLGDDRLHHAGPTVVTSGQCTTDDGIARMPRLVTRALPPLPRQSISDVRHNSFFVYPASEITSKEKATVTALTG